MGRTFASTFGVVSVFGGFLLLVGIQKQVKFPNPFKAYNFPHLLLKLENQLLKIKEAIPKFLRKSIRSKS
jgi:hypothetical protein